MTVPTLLPDAPGEHWNRNRLLIRLVAVAIGGLGVALCAAQSIGSRIEPALFAAVGLPIVVCFAFVNRRWWFRAVAQLVAVFGSCCAVALLIGARLGDVPDGLQRGAGQLLSTQWPTPRWSSVMVVLGAAVAIAVAIAAELAIHRRWRVLPALPLLLGLVAMIALSAPHGPAWPPLVAVAVATFVFLLVGDARQAIVPTRVLVTAVALGASMFAIASSVAYTARANPRSEREAASQLEVVDQLAQSVAERALAPAVSLYRVSSEDLPRLELWRTAALDRYDGQVWSSSGELLPVGVQVGPDSAAPNVSVSITVEPAAPVFLPIPGAIIRATAIVETDRDRRVVRLADSTRPATVGITVEPVGSLSGSDQVMVADEPPTEVENALASFATLLVGNAVTVSDRVRTLASVLRERYALNPRANGAGLQSGLMDRFLRDTEQGTEEQFVTGFVLLVRSLGGQARVATGYRLQSSSTSDVVTTADATSWPEVRTVDGLWRAVDVVPATVSPNDPGVPTVGSQQAPGLDQPLPPAEAQAATEQPALPDVPGDVPTTRLQDFARLARQVATVLGLFVALPVLAVVLTILLVKRRRRAGLRSQDPGRRVVTAWLLASDALVDAGVSLRRSTTNAELVEIGSRVQPTSADSLRQLSEHANVSVFASSAVTQEHAADAVVRLREIERSIARSSSLTWRLRWWISTRSLRRSTRSPLRDR